VRLGVLNNLRAGRNEARFSQLRAFLGGYPDILHAETESCESVPEALAGFANREVGVLAVNGGDGTLQRALTTILADGIFERPPLIAALRGGRTNMSAIDLGCRRGTLAALAALVDATRNGGLASRVVERPVLRVDLGPGDNVQYGMFCGAGVVHRGVELVHRVFPPGRSQGTFGAGVVTALLVARAALRSAHGLLAPDRIEASLEGEPLAPRSFLLMMATTLGRLFLGIRPFWGTGAGPVRVTAIAAGAERLWASAVGIFRGSPPAHVTPDAGYTSRNVHRAELRLDCGLTIDGELFPPQRGRVVRIDADRRVRFIHT
jgi:hypothetical protein